ncbi:MAG: hypothetical protein OFPI_45020 [Osedax symbiont Rs2]|nr:MAG: hypothetical protein OFPI_45020 [Osedax symbiont Rs2]
MLWNEFVQEQGLVTNVNHLKELRAYDQSYHAGSLDAQAYQRFTMKLFPLHSMSVLVTFRDKYFATKIKPVLLVQATALIKYHHDRGDITVLMSATNNFLTDPLCELWGMCANLSTKVQLIKGRMSGSVVGEPSFQQGKVINLMTWLEDQAMADRKINFYSDSHNDLPLLERVDYPVAVDPDSTLRSKAAAMRWPIISLRDD